MRLAQEHPQEAAEILERAAKTFANLAMDPRYADRKGEYELFSREFARAIPEAPPEGTIDDFNQLLDEAYAADSEGVGQAPSFNRDLQEIGKQSGLAEAAPRISIAPATFDDKTILGRVARLKYNPTSDEMSQGILQSDTVVFWQGKKWEAQALTVDIGVLNITDLFNYQSPSSTANFRAYGLVEYGSDGFKVQVPFDVGLGVRFTVPGNYISVLVGMDAPGTSIVTDEPFGTAVLAVGGSLGTFAAPTTTPMTRTLYIDRFPAGGLNYYPRPLKSTSILPVQNSDPSGSVQLYFVSGPDESTAPLQGLITTIVIPAGTQVAPIPIPPDTTVIGVRNLGAVTANFRIPCQLSL